MRIVSLAPSNTEILFALGAETEIVAVTHLCDYPPEVRKKQKIGTWINTNPEQLHAYKPDVIFTSYFLPESLKSWRGLEKIIHVEPKTLEGVYESIQLIGDVIGKKQRAKQLVARMKQELETIQKSTPPTRKRVKVYMEEWHEPPFASGNWVPELVDIAGGVEGIVRKGEASRPFALEDLFAFNPHIIVCHWCGFGKRNDPERVLKRNGWGGLRAIQNKSVYFLDDSLINRPGPRLIEGARALYQIFSTDKT